MEKIRNPVIRIDLSKKSPAEIANCLSLLRALAFKKKIKVKVKN